MTAPWQPLDASYVDCLTVVIPYLRLELAPVRVSLSLAGWRRPDPVVQLHRVGGGVVGVDDGASVQVDVRADGYDACSVLSERVRHSLRLAPGRGVLRGSIETIGPDWTPDEDQQGRVRMNWLLIVGPGGP